MSLAILVPVLRRPQNVAPLLDSIRAATPNARTLFIADPGDREEIAEIEANGAEHIAPGGNYASKINAGAVATTEEMVFTGADDLDFIPGWFEAASALMSATIGVVGTVDNCNPRTINGDHSTHSLVARWYCELGQIDGRAGLMHTGYDHNFCDDELLAIARVRDAYEHCPDAIVEHLHPNAGRALADDVYERGMQNFRTDRRHFLTRMRRWG